MQLEQWNRLRHDTYKNNREEENQYIEKVGEVGPSSPAVASSTSAQSDPKPGRPHVYRYFEVVESGTHTVQSGKSEGKKQKYSLWKCVLPNCRGFHGKVSGGSTGVLFRHLESEHKPEHNLARLASSHSKVGDNNCIRLHSS